MGNGRHHQTLSSGDMQVLVPFPFICAARGERAPSFDIPIRLVVYPGTSGFASHKPDDMVKKIGVGWNGIAVDM
jgi:hypothetical protein